ncbi:hypothetical protein [Methylobacterium oxalidis]|uniref:hypothetical protein n=1 Tax=Methylobacterium oxalidis TaxID=944322 RepID=UPI003315A4D3
MAPFSAFAPVSSQAICRQMTSAIEGGVDAWCSGAKLISSEIPCIGRPWYSDTKLYEGHFVIQFTEHENSSGTGTKHDLTPQKLQGGLKLLSEKCPERVSEMLSEQGHASTADMLIRASLFGKIVDGCEPGSATSSSKRNPR